jgi:hypothetical protein
MKLTLLALAAASVLVLSPNAAAAQGIVRVQLDSAVTVMRGEGFALQGGFLTGSLANGAREALTLNLAAGSHVVMAVCDEDCSDLDLQLADAAGNEVGSDYELDDVPMVAAEVSRAGRYRLTVSMASCSIEPCAYGVAVFKQR